MKFFSLIFFSLLICLINCSAFASKTFQITCDQNVQGLSDQFIANQWIKTTMPWYASWAHDYMSGYLFVGGMRTIKDKYPTDPDPHLSFINPTVDYDEERGEIVMCRYKIGDSELMDIDNVLEMRVFLYSLPENACYVSSKDTVTCNE